MMSGDANESTTGTTASQHHLDDGVYQQNSKRVRYLDGWEACLAPTQDRKPLGLSDLFGASDKTVSGSNTNTTSSSTLITRPTQPPTSTQDAGNTGHAFFSLRLEHREGGALARHPGEERILLFRSDRPGAIAKIIYCRL